MRNTATLFTRFHAMSGMQKYEMAAKYIIETQVTPLAHRLIADGTMEESDLPMMVEKFTPGILLKAAELCKAMNTWTPEQWAEVD